MITKPTFVGPDFVRGPVKLERFIRPMALRQKRANVTHPGLAVTVQLPILSVKKNPQDPMYTRLGVLTKGTIIEVNVSDLGMTTTSGKVVWGRWAQITSRCNPRKTRQTRQMRTGERQAASGRGHCANSVADNPENDGCVNAYVHLPFLFFFSFLLSLSSSWLPCSNKNRILLV